jgi:hypothetical protein
MKTKPLLNRDVQLAFGPAILTLLVEAASFFSGTISSGESGWLVEAHQ